jgi:hypothetical protein
MEYHGNEHPLRCAIRTNCVCYLVGKTLGIVGFS